MTILACVTLAVVAFGHNGGQAAQDTGPQKSPGHYPVTSNQSTGHAPRVAQPRPTVSYPIKFNTAKTKRKRPAPAVSYPIDFSTLGSSR
ncbi:hypothetical protein OHB41_51700 [Streptomyces sp. NBC_01571]|uniref:hypothetical protein n=1 Tax=Streptomyces sp. NBC_01571 TaxID=2975883 RepID=UPI00225139AB|nr:hypothetical protein [Streptomyces sp. NBC_01571]MCX4581425.1 hypothetical protein [Streptomyces sp. NBC_01571]